MQMIVKDRVEDIDQVIDGMNLNLSKPQMNHLKNYTHGLITSENKTIEGISKHIVDSPDQSNLNRFLTNPRINRREIDFKMLRNLVRNKDGGTVILDDSNIAKTGKEMEGAGYHYDHSEGRTIYCHNIVTSAYLDKNDNLWPLFNQPYLKQDIAEELGYQFHTKITLAKRILGGTFCLLNPSHVVVDSWYFSKDLIDFIEDFDVTWVTKSKCNRKVYFDGEELRVDSLPDKISKDKFEEIDVKVSDTKYIQASKPQLEMKNLDKTICILILEKENGEYEYLASNKTDWKIMEMLNVWKQRWSIETLHKDCKQELGLGAYQMRNMNGIVIHLSLVFLAYALLKALSCYSKGLLNGLADTIGEACRWIKVHLLANLTNWVIKLYERLEEVEKVVELVQSKCTI